MVWDPPDWTAGTHPDGFDLEAVSDQIVQLTHPGWTDYSTSMVIDGATTDPTLGNSTLQALYRRCEESDVVDFTFKLTIGSTFSAGSGIYTFSLPIDMMSPQIWTGPAIVFDTGTAMRSAAVTPIAATGVLLYVDGSGAALGSTGPAGAGWATGDYVSMTIRYGV